MIDKKEKNRASAKRLKICDTLIVSSSPENYDKILMREAKWYPIPIGEQRIPQIKYLAIYQSAPISSITSIFKVESINYYSYTDSDNIRGLDVSLQLSAKFP